jgi:membrane peptidoglycan carboxypeptidase
VAKLIGLLLVAGVLLAGVLFPVVGGLGMLSNKTSTAAESVSAALVNKPPPAVTTVTERDGNPIATLYDQYRIPVSAKEISTAMKVAIVSIEDARFYQHGPLDPKGIVRAGVNDATGGALQGASTLTQQYVKNYRINVTDRNDKTAQQRDRSDTIARKLREARIAGQVGAHLDKQQILTGYLNVTSFAPRVFGVEAAARVFFHTHAAQLTLTQSALLAGVVNNPNAYNPWQHPQAARHRRNTVLTQMVQQKKISPRRGSRAMAQPLGVTPEPQRPSSSCIGAPHYAGFFCDYVENYLHRHGWSKQQIESGGYTIKTSLDPQIAKTAKKAAQNKVSPTADGVAAAFSVIQTGKKSHHVLAMVSNRDYGLDPSKGQTTINVVSGVTDGFGGGSTFKIFTAAAALEQGKAGLDTELPNAGYHCVPKPQKIRTKYTPPYCVHNLGSYPNPISLHHALAVSPNVAFVNLEKTLNTPTAVDMAYRLGMRRTLRHDVLTTPPGEKKPQPTPESEAYRYNLSFTLGDAPLSPLEEANVTTTIKSDGVWCPPNPILSITGPNGKPVPVPTQPCEQAISPDVAHALIDGLSHDTIDGTSAQAAKAVGWHRPDIGKTGTTNSNESLVFAGGVNNYGVSSAVYADGTTPAPICPASTVTHVAKGCSDSFGGTVASPIYFNTFQKILKDTKTPPLPKAKDSFRQAGPHGPIVPFVMMKPADEAKTTLAKAGYHNVITKTLKTPGPQDAAGGTVTGQTPMGNAATNTPITLYVSPRHAR